MGGVLLPYQLRYVLCDDRHLIYKKSRRIGISWAHALWSVRRRLTRKIDEIFVSANLNTSTEYIRYVKNWAQVLNLAVREEAVDLSGATTQVVTMPNGSRIIALSSNPTALRGLGGDLCWDEAAHHPCAGELYTACQPVVQWGGCLRVISTPAGTETIFERLFGDEGNGYTRIKTTLPEAVGEGLALKVPGDHRDLPDRQACDEQFIRGIRATCLSDAAYRQEYLCENVSEETIVTPEQYDACVLPGLHVPDELPPGKFGPLFIGIDIGRAAGGNLTVIWVVERGHDPKAAEHLQEVYRTIAVKELSGTPFPLQAEIIDRFISHRQVQRVVIDAGGLGMSLAEQMVEKFGRRVEALKSTQTSKAVMCERLARHVYERRIALPPSPAVRADLCAMRRIPLVGGGFRYQGTAGQSNCDRFLAAAYSLQAAQQPTFRVINLGEETP